MRTFGTIAFLVLCAFFIISNAAPNVLVIFLLLTLGFGLPLLFLNTVLLYFLAAGPLLIAMAQTRRRWIVVAVAACIVPLVAFGVPWMSQVSAERKMEVLRANDADHRYDQMPKAVELLGDATYYGGPDNRLQSAPCDALCQKLLLSGHVELVRVTRVLESNRPREFQLEYVIERRDVCPDSFAQGADILSATKDAIVTGRCFIARPAGTHHIAVQIGVWRRSGSEPKNLDEDMRQFSGSQKEIQSLTIDAPMANGTTEQSRKTQVKYSHWAMPLWLSYASCHGMCIGKPVFARTEKTLNPFDPNEAVLRAFGIADPGQAPQISPAGRVVAMLDRAGETITPNRNQIIVEWSNSMPCSPKGCVPPTAEDEAVLMRLVKDRRVSEFVFVGNVLGRNLKLAAANLETLIGEMEARGANSQFSNIVGAILARLDPSEVMPYRDRMLTLIRDNDWKWSRGMGIMSGRLGLDTAPMIAERLGPAVSSESAALAACIADETIGRQLVPSLLDHLRGQPVSEGFPELSTRTAVKALARFGHYDEAKEIYLAHYPRHGERTLPQQSAAEAPKDVNACYRG